MRWACLKGWRGASPLPGRKRLPGLALVVALAWTVPASLDAQTPVPQIRSHTRATAARTVAPSIPSDDARALAVASRFKQALADLDMQRKLAAQRPAQLRALDSLRGRSRSEVAVRYRSRSGTPHWLHGRNLERAVNSLAGGQENALATSRRFLQRNRDLLLIDDPGHELTHRRTVRDGLGRTQVRFLQRFAGLEVWPAELIVHLDGAGAVDLMNGVFVPTPRGLVRAPGIERARAIQLAREAVPEGASGSVGEPELIIFAPGDRPARLAFRVIVATSLRFRWLVVVDAHDGAILAHFNTVHTDHVAGHVEGSGVDLLGATRVLDLWSENGVFYAVDTSKAMYDTASDPPEPENTRGVITIKDAANQPSSSQPLQIPATVVAASAQLHSGLLPDAVSAAANLSSVYDYFFSVHGRLAIDGDGGSILSIVRLGQDYDNAFFVPGLSLMAFGTGRNWAGALDIVAHEFAHGVTANSSNLIYTGQSGALNEAISDIFGELVEEFANGSLDWRVGSIFPNPLRDLQAPSSIAIQPGLSYPSKMSETSLDNGGVHLNSGIINHAFYQLAEGLPGAIGTAEAARILYRANTVYLTANSQFIDARLACIQAAEDLFGAGSVQAVRVGEAFDFVEIFDGEGTPPPAPLPETSGVDATFFLFADPLQEFCGPLGAGACLGREDLSLGDSPGGVVFNQVSVPMARPSVVGDGSTVAYRRGVDVCLAAVLLTDVESCLDLPALGLFVSSVSLSPLADFVGFVLLDEATNEPRNVITVFDLSSGAVTDFTLVAPALDGATVANVISAHMMNFTVNGDALVYDAFNVIEGASGSYGAWSIYELEIATGTTFSIVPPVRGLQILDPALAHTSDRHLTFEAMDDQTGVSTVFASNLETGDLGEIGQTRSRAVPSYTGDDSAIVYALDDAAAGLGATDTGSSLFSQGVGSDRLTPVGERSLWLENASFGVVYRRGSFDPTPLGECEDGIDNDGDALIDFPADPGCESLQDPLEVPEPAAVGLQLAALLTLAELRRRRTAGLQPR